MEIEEKKNSLKPILHGRRNVKFFDITGHTLVHPLSYNMQGFQKQIIMTAIYRNTLISLPPGLGMPFLASVIVFNFQRWFLNGKIVVLSQTKSCIVEQINAYNTYTTLSTDSYSDLYGNTSVTDIETEWSKPIVLSTPAKFLDSIQTKQCKVNDLILLIVYETNKITKCQEYKDIMNLLSGLNFRVNIFIDGGGINTKSLKQVVETFSISQIEFRDLFSLDIKECTFRSEIESVSLEISPHMISIKDAFYTVYEKYGKLLKDARVITGNVASFTKHQVQKAKEKLMKTPPQNMNKDTLLNLLDAMTMCSFLCVGIDILHNWGVRSFYNYLFDENKESELKRLIVKDEQLKTQMKLLNEYLKSHGKKMESLISRIVHPKLIYLKNLILRSFSEVEGINDDFRIVIFCSMDEIVDDINRMISILPNSIRHQCVKTKSKSLSNTKEYKEVVQNFNNNVINVLVLNNLIDEINELRANLVVSLEPNKTLIKFSDPKFYRGPDKCFFILTKGNEYLKFESMLNEKKNEQKSIELPAVDHILQDSPSLFPEGFNPDFESTSAGPLVSNSDRSIGQKTLLNYLKSENKGKSKKSISVFNDSDFIDSSVFVSNDAPRKLPFSNRSQSPSLFESRCNISEVNDSSVVDDEVKDSDNFYEQPYMSPQPVPYAEQLGYSNATKDNAYDSCDDLILDFSVPQHNKTKNKPTNAEEPLKNYSSDKENLSLEFCNSKNSKCLNDMNHNEFKEQRTDAESSIVSKLQSLRDCAANLPLNLCPKSSSDDIPNSKPASPVSKSASIFDTDDILQDFNSATLQNEMFAEISLFGESKDGTRLNENSRTNIDVINATEHNSTSMQKEITLFGNSNDNMRSNKNSCPSIDIVNATRCNSTNFQKEISLLEDSNSYTRSNKNARTSIDIVNETVQNPTPFRKNILKEITLSESSNDCTRLSKNFRTSIDSTVNDTRQNTTKKDDLKEILLFENSKHGDNSGANSRTSINCVNETRPNPVSIKSPIFSAKKSNIRLSKYPQIPLKDRSASIHFDSSFEFDDDLALANFSPENPTMEEKRPPESVETKRSDDSSAENEDIEEKPPDMANIDDWDPDCELFQDEDTFDNIVADIDRTPQKDPISAKTSTPIVNSKTLLPKKTSPLAKAPQVFDLASPPRKPIGQLNSTESRKIVSVEPLTTTPTELPKPNRSQKNSTNANKCDINISDNCRKKAISNSFFSNFSISLKQRCHQSKNTATNAKPSRIDEDNDDFPWMRTDTKSSEKTKLNTNCDDEPVYSWLKKSPRKPSNNSCGSSWLKKSPVNAAFSSTNSNNPNKVTASTFSTSPSSDLSDVTNRISGSTSNSPSIAHSTPDFKKPGPFVIRSSASKSAHSSSGSDQKSVYGDSTPELRSVKNRKKKKTKLKRNLAEQFLDNEAEVTSGDSDGTNTDENSNMSHYENDSFIDDEATNKNVNYAHYLKSIKSPRTTLGKFHIPILSESKLRMDVCSQMDYYDQTYQQDSFCVDDVESIDQDSEYVPSVLTQMEDKLKFEKKKTKRLQTVSSGEDSSNEQTKNTTVRQKKKHRKRIVCFSSSDSDDAK